MTETIAIVLLGLGLSVNCFLIIGLARCLNAVARQQQRDMDLVRTLFDNHYKVHEHQTAHQEKLLRLLELMNEVTK